MITSPLRSRWQAHGELRIAVTSGPRHELLLNDELVLRMVFSRLKVSSQGSGGGGKKAKASGKRRNIVSSWVVNYHVNLVLCIQQSFCPSRTLSLVARRAVRFLWAVV